MILLQSFFILFFFIKGILCECYMVSVRYIVSAIYV